MKNVTNPESSVSNQVKRARVKWLKLKLNSNMKAVFTTEGLEGSFDDVVKGTDDRLRKGEEAIIFSENGEMVHLKK